MQTDHFWSSPDSLHILNSAPDVIWCFSLRRRCYTYINNSVMEVCGISREVLMKNYRALLNLIHPEDLLGSGFLIKSSPHNTWLKREFRILHPNGETRWLLDRFYITKHEQDLLVHGITSNITQLKLQAYQEAQQAAGVSSTSESNHAERRLQQRLQFESEVARLAMQMIDSEQLDSTIQKLLSFMGKITGACRSYVFLIRADSPEIMDNTHEWCAEGVESMQSLLQNLRCASFPWLINKLQQQHIVSISNVEQLPDQAAAERRILLEQKIKSLLLVSIVGKQLIGFMGFDNVRKERSDWLPQDVINLSSIASTIGNAVERHRIATRLQKSEARYRSLVESIKEIVFQTDLAGHWTLLNPAWSSITGFSVRESLGKYFLDYVHPIDQVRSLEYFDALVNRRIDSYRHELLYRKKNLSPIWIEVFAQGVFDDGGNMIGTAGTLTDITQKKASEELKQQNLLEQERQNFLHSILMNADALIVVADINGQLRFTNINFNLCFGELAHETDNAKLWLKLANRNFSQLIKCLPFSCETSTLISKQRRRIISWNFSTFSLEAQATLIGVGFDITNRRESEMSLYQAMKMVTLGEMATGMAHELNQPLNGIRLTCHNLERLVKQNNTTDKEKILHKIERIQSYVERSAGIINHMRIFGRRGEAHVTAFDPLLAVHGALSLVGWQMRQSDIAVNIVASPATGQVLAEQSRLEQVLLNLLINARDAIVKFSEKSFSDYKGKIHIELSHHSEQWVCISLCDNGGGIEPALLDRIFEPFFTTKPVGKGTGLGLSLSYGIIRDFNGDLSVHNTPEGACFMIMLPAAADAGKVS